MDSAKEVWDELKRIHGVSGKGRLASMLQRFYRYQKASNKSIDQITSALIQLSNEIYNIAPNARPSQISHTVMIMNTCQDDEYNMAKYTLGQADNLTPQLTVEQLRTIKQDVNDRDNANIARRTRGRRPGPGSRGQSNRDLSGVKCYNCGEHDHYSRDYEKPRKPKDGDEAKPE